MTKESCANRLRQALSIRGTTQADLCRLTGIPKSAMSQYCNGGLLPRQDRLFLIARALNVSEAWLMGFDVPQERRNSPIPETEDGREVEVKRLFDALSEEGKASALNYLRYLASNADNQ